MKTLHIILLLIFLTAASVCRAQVIASRHSFISLVNNQNAQYFIGIEYAELAQNKFRDLGRDNYTFLVGQRFGNASGSKLGWRYMIINAELSGEHIQNVNQVKWIEGNREDLTGDVYAQRLGLDYYPVTIGIGHIKKWDRNVLEISPVLYAALGYNSWGFTNTLYDESYRLKAFTAGGGIRLQSVLFDLLFIENPFMDFFTYLVKNRSVYGEIGDTQITRPEHFGMFSWASVGIRLEF